MCAANLKNLSNIVLKVWPLLILRNLLRCQFFFAKKILEFFLAQPSYLRDVHRHKSHPRIQWRKLERRRTCRRRQLASPLGLPTGKDKGPGTIPRSQQAWSWSLFVPRFGKQRFNFSLGLPFPGNWLLMCQKDPTSGRAFLPNQYTVKFENFNRTKLN